LKDNALKFVMKKFVLIVGVLAVAFLPLTRAALLPAKSAITAVTVYSDRAVVTRQAVVTLDAIGVVEVAFDQLPAALVDQSLQVTGRGVAQATILDVTPRITHVDFTPNERVKALQDEQRTLQKQRRVFDDRAAGLKSQENSLERIESSATTAPTKDSAPRLTIEESTKLLTFLAEQRSRLAAERQAVDSQTEELTAKQSAVERQLNELRGAGSRSFKTVVVRLDAASTGELGLALSYTLPGASWAPNYDVRVNSAERAVELGYFGLVRQNTGEDWKDVVLTLSTARPSLGGQPPSLATWVVDMEDAGFKRKKLEETTDRMRGQLGFGATGASAPDKNLLYKNYDGYAGQALIGGNLPMSTVVETAGAIIDAHVTSASFKVTTPASVASDNSPQKIPITAARLVAAPEYLAIPKQLAAAFLTTKVTNSSEFPLLAGTMNVFLDGTFVATSSLRTVMPGEKFDLALGADDAIAIKRKLNNRFTEDTGIVTKGKRVTYDSTLTVQNNKKTAEKIVVLDQLPISRNEKVVVKLLAPDDRELKPETDGTLRWTLTLKPGEKREIPLKFAIEYAADVQVAGLD
jgi:uncharacterized protein (TIGR02231 family)